MWFWVFKKDEREAPVLVKASSASSAQRKVENGWVVHIGYKTRGEALKEKSREIFQTECLRKWIKNRIKRGKPLI